MKTLTVGIFVKNSAATTSYEKVRLAITSGVDCQPYRFIKPHIEARAYIRKTPCGCLPS